jgi:hypothetical protein
MQAFAEFMAESYRSNVALTWDLEGLSLARASFTVDSIRVTVSFECREKDGPWHAASEVKKGDGTEVAHSAFAIFNGVFQAAEEFLSVREPELLIFATKREALARIYDTYLRREAETIEHLGYTLDGPIRMDPYQEFLLRRRAPDGPGN